MNIIFRVDASIQIGTGHVMRCLTLADELRSRGCRVQFICRKHPGHMADKIVRQGFEVSLLPEPEQTGETCVDQEDYAAWLGVTQDEDARQTIAVLGSEEPDWFIVDHYGLDAKWEKSLRPYVDKIMVIDDLANREHDCDLLLDQNYFQEPAQRYKGLLLDTCKTLFGPEYALLRKEFRVARQFTRMRGNKIARVLIYFGGSDHNNLTGTALEALSRKELQHLLVEVVIVIGNPHLEKLKKQESDRPGTRLHIQPEGFIELMLRADLCIGAGGTTTWERLCLNIPSIVITVADNQKAFTKELDKAGYVEWIGDAESITASDIENSLVKALQKLRASGLPNLVDGFGALRVTEMILPSDKQELNLRKADLNDMELFYFWANDPAVRDNSFQTEPIPWEDHVTWFTKKIRAADTEMWVMQTPQGLPLGQVRFDKDGTVMNISYSLDPIARGKGLGARLLELGISKVSESNSDAVIQAQVKKDNPASRKIFINLGFNETTENEVITFTKNIL